MSPAPDAPAATSSASSATPRRRLTRAWIPPLVVVLVLLLVALAGGFRSAPAAGVRTLPAGEPIVLQRWVLTVQDVELVDTDAYGGRTAPTLRVRLEATWTGERTTYGLATGLVAVVVPGGPPAATEPSTPTVDGYFGGFDPDVARPVVMEFTWPDGASEDAPRRPLPETVDVVVSDERPAQNFLFADEWTTTRPLGHVALTPRDGRAG